MSDKPVSAEEIIFSKVGNTLLANLYHQAKDTLSAITGSRGDIVNDLVTAAPYAFKADAYDKIEWPNNIG